MVINRLVDKKIDGFLGWKEKLEKEDERETGGAVRRPFGEMRKLYQIYIDFQSSPEACEARAYLYGKDK